MILSGKDDLLSHRITQSRDAVEWRQEFPIDHEELRSVRFFQINRQEGEAAQVHFSSDFDDGRISFFHGCRLVERCDAGQLLLHGRKAAQDDGCIEGAFGTDGEVGGIVGQRLIDLEPRDAEGHHNIGDGMGSREEVADLEAGVDEPLRHMCGVKLGAVIRAAFFEALAFTDIFHDFEGCQGLHAMLDEVVHDVVSGRDRILQFDDAVLDEVLGIVQPYVSAVGEAGNTDQLREILRARVFEHAADEGRPVFRQAEGSDGDAFISDRTRKLIRRQAQCLGRTEEGQCLLVVEGDLQRVDTGDVLQHTDDLRIIVAQNIQLQHTAGDGMIIEVCGDGPGDLPAILILQVFFICGVLERREIVNIHITRADHDACRMLAGRALHPGYTGGEFFDENIIECQPAVLRVFLDEAIGCFILNACDCAGTEDIVAAEKLFGIFVRDALIVSRGEIKVDIRHLVSVESEENGERDVMPVL